MSDATQGQKEWSCLAALLKERHQDAYCYNRRAARELGHVAALVLNQVAHWSSKSTRRDKAFFRTDDAWCRELSMSRKTVRNARNSLVMAGLISTSVEGDPRDGHGGVVTLYRLQIDEYFRFCGVSDLDRWSHADPPEPAEAVVPKGQSDDSHGSESGSGRAQRAERSCPKGRAVVPKGQPPVPPICIINKKHQEEEEEDPATDDPGRPMGKEALKVEEGEHPDTGDQATTAEGQEEGTEDPATRTKRSQIEHLLAETGICDEDRAAGVAGFIRFWRSRNDFGMPWAPGDYAKWYAAGVKTFTPGQLEAAVEDMPDSCKGFAQALAKSTKGLEGRPRSGGNGDPTAGGRSRKNATQGHKRWWVAEAVAWPNARFLKVRHQRDGWEADVRPGSDVMVSIVHPVTGGIRVMIGDADLAEFDLLEEIDGEWTPVEVPETQTPAKTGTEG